MTTFNRKRVTKLCLENIDKYRRSASLCVLDDHSTEYDLEELKSWTRSSAVVRLPNKMGINNLRVAAHKIAQKNNSKYVYHIDNDAYHDPNWMIRMYELSQEHKGVLGLYNTSHHFVATIKENTDVIHRRACPGLSFFYEVSALKEVPTTFNNSWDFLFGDRIGNTLISKISYVEHLGADGIHNADFERDRAHNPTLWLKRERARLIPLLMNKETP